MSNTCDDCQHRHCATSGDVCLAAEMTLGMFGPLPCAEVRTTFHAKTDPGFCVLWAPVRDRPDEGWTFEDAAFVLGGITVAGTLIWAAIILILWGLAALGTIGGN